MSKFSLNSLLPNNSRYILGAIVLWQLISVGLMATGVWPDWVTWINVILTALFIAYADPHEGLLLLIASIPFFVALPNQRFQSFPTWRILFIWLFLTWLLRTFIKQRQYLYRILHFRQMYREAQILEQSKLELVWTTLKRIDSRFMPWDKYLALFMFVSALSLIFARFRVQSIKQMIFLINIYLIYVVLINTTTTRQRVIDLIKYGTLSTAIIVGLGYIQFIATLFSSQYYFWQYWAVMVSRLYYGLPLANILVYSNSWFSYTGGKQELRMFSIMPDSHSFAMVAVFCIGFALALLCMNRKPKNLPGGEQKSWWRGMLTSKNYYIWYLIRFTGLAVVLSGTRGIWVGMLAPLVVSGLLYYKNIARQMVKKVFWAEVLIIVFFAISPLINYGLNLFRVTEFQENFIQRAETIYDLKESSNMGRLVIWKDSIVYALTHPFGVGYGNFVVSLVRDIPEGATFSEVSSEKNLRYNLPQKFVSAHSLYLNILVELGFAGILVFAVFWWEYASGVWRFVRDNREQDNIFTMFVVSMAFTMLWFLAYGVFDVTFFNDKVLMYFFLSLGITGIIIRRYDSFKGASESSLSSTAPEKI